MLLVRGLLALVLSVREHGGFLMSHRSRQKARWLRPPQKKVLKPPQVRMEALQLRGLPEEQAVSLLLRQEGGRLAAFEAKVS